MGVLPKKILGVGFEPTKCKTADLKSAPFDRSGILVVVSFRTMIFIVFIL